ncbi:hypothetical protein N8Z40_05790, partial [Pseudomonadales bacterium]|nr:hypothetical protein [Pseudomonadales bacterium]
MARGISFAHLGLLLVLLASCGGGGSSSQEQSAVNSPVSTTPASIDCGSACALSVDDVELVIAQAVAEAKARNIAGTIAVVDRVGNVLGVFQMQGADEFITITSTADLGGPVVGGLESLNFIP